MRYERSMALQVKGFSGLIKKMSKKKSVKGTRAPVKEGTTRYICIVCPTCCNLETDGLEVLGARCERGEAFARQEMVSPLRVLTTTIRCKTERETRMLPVKTASAVPLEETFEIMKYIKAMRLTRVPPIGSKLKVEMHPEPLELIVTGE